MLGRALTSVFWGIVADRYGRKPVIIIGTTTVLVTAIFISNLKFILWLLILKFFISDILNLLFLQLFVLKWSQGCFQHSIWA